MIDDAGHLIHIDFGFIYDFTPGIGNFERSPFKLSKEMLLMLGEIDSPYFKFFSDNFIRGFLAIREYAADLELLAILAIDSGLPCFKNESIMNFRSRLALHLSGDELITHILSIIEKSLSYISLATTHLYDMFQKQSNNIDY